MHKTQKKSVIFEEINNKMTKLDIKFSLIEQSLNEEVGNLNSKLEYTRNQIKSNREETTAVENKVDQTRSEISMIHETVMKIKEEIIGQVSSIDEDLHNQLANIRINLNSMNEKVQTATMRISNHSDELEGQQKTVETNSYDIKAIEVTLKNLKETKIDKEVYEKEMTRSISETQKVSFSQQDLMRNIQATDNYIEKYLPITLQNYITETLSNVIENRKILGRLLKYDIQIYKRLHERILGDEGVPSLNKRDYEIIDMDTIRRKMEMIEDQEILNDTDDLPSEYSISKSQKKRKRKSRQIDPNNNGMLLSNLLESKMSPGVKSKEQIYESKMSLNDSQSSMSKISSNQKRSKRSIKRKV